MGCIINRPAAVRRPATRCLSGLALLLVATALATAAEDAPTVAADRSLARFFERETRQLQEACLSDVHSIADWDAERTRAHAQLLEMFGLDAAALTPATTDELAAVVTGRLTF